MYTQHSVAKVYSAGPPGSKRTMRISFKPILWPTIDIVLLPFIIWDKAEHGLPAAYLRVIPTDLVPGKSLPAPATVRVLELPVPAGRVKGAHRYSVGIFDLPTDT